MIWLIGNKGMLGTELALALERAGLPHIGTDREVDITDPAVLLSFAEKQAESGQDFTWIVNCAAYTAVDKAEEDAETCRRLNTGGPAHIAATARKIGARLIHLSTDYVFDGRGVSAGNPPEIRPYREDDKTGPIGVYGLTKRDGEIAVLENNPASYIIRTAWLYGQYGRNFVATMLRLMKERDTLSVVNDQRGSPTWAPDLAGAILALMDAADRGTVCAAAGPRPLKSVPWGIYHYTNEGNITWFDFAREIYDRGRKLGILTRDCAVKPCTSAEYPAKVKRPAYSVLDKTKIKTALGITIPPWDKSLAAALRTF